MTIVANVAAAVKNVGRLPDDPWWWAAITGFQLLIAVWMFRQAQRARSRIGELRCARQMNVRVLRADGEVVPCELSYAGVRDGQHEWVIVNVVVLPGDEVLVGELPPKTSVVGVWAE